MFHSTSWGEHNKPSYQTIDQIWLDAIYLDFGDGYLPSGLSNILHQKLIDKAIAKFLFIDDDWNDEINSDLALDLMNDSRKGLGRFFSKQTRGMWQLCDQSEIETIQIHQSVMTRCTAMDYDPKNLQAKS